jgi:hypothetical protein
MSWPADSPDWFVPPIRALEVPDLRARLLEKFRPGSPYRELWPAALGDTELAASPEEIEAEEANLRLSALFWVSDDMRTVLEAAAAAIPEEMTLRAADPPCGEQFGFVVFERPFECPDVRQPSESMHWSAFRYSLIHRHGLGRRGRQAHEPRWNMHFTYYSYGPGNIGLYPVGHSEWKVGAPITWVPEVDRDSDPEVMQDVFTDRRRFMAFALLVNQQLLTEVEESEGPRAVRRRSERAGVPSKVKIVQLRRTSSGHPHVGSDPVGWSHRWIVNGHWRQQPCGPGRQERRWTFIAPHIKGPADKPLVVKETVRAVVR